MIFADGFDAPEGPVALPDGSWLIVEGGADRGCVTHISADGKKETVIKKTGVRMVWQSTQTVLFGLPNPKYHRFCA
jgi:hypothetical protein